MEPHIVEAPALPDEVSRALADFHPILQRILFRRNITDKEEALAFFAHGVRYNRDPFQLEDMERAVQAILRAVQAGQLILIHGDYDADGVTGTALLKLALERLGGKVRTLIPHRIEDGYGLGERVLREAHEQGVSLVLTVDCGIRANAVAAELMRRGIEVVITDHHEPDGELPHASAVVDPKRRDDRYPFGEFAGVGVAYKLAQALWQVRGLGEPEEFLDLVALGTIADMAPLVEENRELVHRGLEVFNAMNRPGLRKLAERAGFRNGTITATNIAFGIGPRINAAGRLQSAQLALDLLLAEEEGEAESLATRLDELNRNRQKMTADLVEIARETCEGTGELPPVIVLEGAHFDEGVIGLVAARLAEEYHRPAIVAARKGEHLKASARSVPGFNITQALGHCDDLLIRFGGHEAAAGLEIVPDNLEAFRQRIGQIARKELKEVIPRPVLHVDAKVRFRDLTWDLLDQLERLEPCGVGNPPPLLMARGVQVNSARAVGHKGRHLKMTLASEGIGFDAIAFRLGELAPKLNQGSKVDVLFHLERNRYLGVESLQLNAQWVRRRG
jgi:single-stranded-DNA-specific exonuclease